MRDLGRGGSGREQQLGYKVNKLTKERKKEGKKAHLSLVLKSVLF